MGVPVVVEAPAPNTHYGAVFEADGDTGYFYGLDRTHEDRPSSMKI